MADPKGSKQMTARSEKAPAKLATEKTIQLVTGGADLSKGYKSLGKSNPAKAPGTGPTSDTVHQGYRTAATQGKGASKQ